MLVGGEHFTDQAILITFLLISSKCPCQEYVTSIPLVHLCFQEGTLSCFLTKGAQAARCLAIISVRTWTVFCSICMGGGLTLNDFSESF